MAVISVTESRLRSSSTARPPKIVWNACVLTFEGLPSVTRFAFENDDETARRMSPLTMATGTATTIVAFMNVRKLRRTILMAASMRSPAPRGRSETACRCHMGGQPTPGL